MMMMAVEAKRKEAKDVESLKETFTQPVECVCSGSIA